jgi:hypothetical protein
VLEHTKVRRKDLVENGRLPPCEGFRVDFELSVLQLLVQLLARLDYSLLHSRLVLASLAGLGVVTAATRVLLLRLVLIRLDGCLAELQVKKTP